MYINHSVAFEISKEYEFLGFFCPAFLLYFCRSTQEMREAGLIGEL